MSGAHTCGRLVCAFGESGRHTCEWVSGGLAMFPDLACPRRRRVGVGRAAIPRTRTVNLAVSARGRQLQLSGDGVIT